MGNTLALPLEKGIVTDTLKRPLAKLSRASKRRNKTLLRLQLENTIMRDEESRPLTENSSRRSQTVTETSLPPIVSSTGCTSVSSQTGVALGIPPQHLVDDSSAEAIHANVQGHDSSGLSSSSGVTPEEQTAPGVNSSPNNDILDGQVSSPPVANSREALPESANLTNRQTQQNDPDAITPAPPVQNKTPSDKPTVSLAEMEENPYVCSICLLEYGANREVGDAVDNEKKAHLPCGHTFGHHCLIQWIASPKPGGTHLRCPRDCISLRHSCQHLTAPTTSEHGSIYRDTSTATIPWDYEFCQSRTGRKLLVATEKLSVARRRAQAVLDAQEGSQAAEMAQVNRPNRFGKLKYLAVLNKIRKSSPAEKKAEALTKKLRKAETKLSRKHLRWYADMWGNRWGAYMNDLEECRQ